MSKEIISKNCEKVIIKNIEECPQCKNPMVKLKETLKCFKCGIEIPYPK